ncbi:unnamed protein product [Caenorhabditis angaria]|uniref:DNA sliding clamp PCNA n=1 Tax=Caenorhabditis angaria TaxID=860376 RepID=A0A9P1INU2_9PELO|nr:unnamed protein product [Caenorhabditis angaria]
MFEAKLANAGLLKKIVESIKDLVTDAPFDCSETSMSLQAMDSSHVAFVCLKLNARFFDTYRCDRPINLGLSLANMSKYLKQVSNDDTCMLKYDEKKSEQIGFIFDGRNSKETEWTLKLMNIDSVAWQIPNEEYSVVCEMPAAEFQKACKELTTFSDTMNIKATRTAITFTGKGDIGSSVVTYSPSSSTDDENDAISLEVKHPVNVNFSIKYMNQFTKATTLGDRVRLWLSNDAPGIVEYPIENNGFLKFHLAPQICDDDNLD